jgi:hypothetical protein
MSPGERIELIDARTPVEDDGLVGEVVPAPNAGDGSVTWQGQGPHPPEALAGSGGARRPGRPRALWGNQKIRSLMGRRSGNADLAANPRVGGRCQTDSCRQVEDDRGDEA